MERNQEDMTLHLHVNDQVSPIHFPQEGAGENSNGVNGGRRWAEKESGEKSTTNVRLLYTSTTSKWVDSPPKKPKD